MPTCPFCFTRLSHPSPWRQVADAPSTEPDLALGRFLDMPPPALGPLSPQAPAVHDARWRPVCANCHIPLPHGIATGQTENHTIALVGARGSGKSNLIAVLIEQLKRRFCADLDFSIREQETFSVRELRPIGSDRLLEQRYGGILDRSRREVVPQTLRAEQDRSQRIPLIYRLDLPRRSRLPSWLGGRRLRPVDLVFFDAAGEDLSTRDGIDRFCSYIFSASAIIFLIDPFQFPGLRDKMSQEQREAQRDLAVDPVGIATSTINLFQQRGRVKATERIPVPVAFAFSKSDLLAPFLDPSSLILRDSDHRRGFDHDDSAAVSAEVEGLLSAWNSPQLVQDARTSFAQHRYFAISAFGGAPDAQGRVPGLRPLRIADPLLWTLNRLGVIPARN